MLREGAGEDRGEGRGGEGRGGKGRGKRYKNFKGCIKNDVVT